MNTAFCGNIYCVTPFCTRAPKGFTKYCAVCLILIQSTSVPVEYEVEYEVEYKTVPVEYEVEYEVEYKTVILCKGKKNTCNLQAKKGNYGFCGRCRK
jgi:hypothetical protein